MAEPDIAQPLPLKVNPQKWTTKVNIAVVIAVVAILVVGAIYAAYAVRNPSEVQDKMHQQSTPEPNR